MQATTSDLECEMLPWDSEFFGLPIARIRRNTLMPELQSEIDQWCAVQGVACLYFLARSDDAPTVEVAEQSGFHLADVRITFERSLGPEITGEAADCLPVRSAHLDDLSGFRMIARNSYSETRFFYDSHFPRERSEALYERWIEASCEGYADAVLTTGPEGRPTGFVSCHVRRATETGEIGLVGVAAGARGQGTGNSLVRRSLEWFAAKGLRRATVVTQGRNVAAQRLYQRSGFVTRDTQLFYHKWYPTYGEHV